MRGLDARDIKELDTRDERESDGRNDGPGVHKTPNQRGHDAQNNEWELDARTIRPQGRVCELKTKRNETSQNRELRHSPGLKNRLQSPIQGRGIQALQQTEADVVVGKRVGGWGPYSGGVSGRAAGFGVLRVGRPSGAGHDTVPRRRVRARRSRSPFLPFLVSEKGGMVWVGHDSGLVGRHVGLEASAQVIDAACIVEVEGIRSRDELGLVEARNGLSEGRHGLLDEKKCV